MTAKELRVDAILDLIQDCFSQPISHITKKHKVGDDTVYRIIARLKTWGFLVQTKPVGRPAPREMTVTQYAEELGLSREQFVQALADIWATYREDQLKMLGEYLENHKGEI